MSTKITNSYLEGFVRTLATGSAAIEDIKSGILQYISPAYTQNRAGQVSNFEETVAHLAQVRGHIKSVDIQVESLVVSADGRQFASRHVAIVNGDMTKQTIVVLFADLNGEGLIERVYELAKVLETP